MYERFGIAPNTMTIRHGLIQDGLQTIQSRHFCFEDGTIFSSFFCVYLYYPIFCIRPCQYEGEYSEATKKYLQVQEILHEISQNNPRYGDREDRLNSTRATIFSRLGDNFIFLGFQVWRLEGSNPFVVDTCETGMGGRGYTLLTPLETLEMLDDPKLKFDPFFSIRGE